MELINNTDRVYAMFLTEDDKIHYSKGFEAFKAEEVVSDNVAPEVQITGANVIKRDEFVTLTVTAYDDNLASFELKKSDILGMTGAGVSVHDIKKISNTEYKVVLLGMETAVGEICIAGGVAVDTAGNRSKETDGVAIKVNPLD